MRTLTALAAVLAALTAAFALAGGAGAAGAPTTPDLHPLASPRAAGWTTISWSPSVFPAGTSGRWYELAVDSFFGPGESLSDHVVYTAPPARRAARSSLSPAAATGSGHAPSPRSACGRCCPASTRSASGRTGGRSPTGLLDPPLECC